MVVMGRVASAYGVRGWVKIQPFSEYVDSLMDYDGWYLGRENGPWRKVEVTQCDVHGKTLVAQLDDCSDRNLAEQMRGLLVAVPRSSLPEQEEGEYYWSDLVGMAVVNEAGESLGTVAELMETGANDVLVVRGSGKDVLIPFLESVIRDVDLAGKMIRVDWAADY